MLYRLIHFLITKQMVLACDVSPYGLGVVLSHCMEDGQERPIAYASRTLTPAEKKYSQLEREGLAIIFGVKKFHNYLYGRKFIIESDHQPLSYLFSESRVVQDPTLSQVQRYLSTGWPESSLGDKFKSYWKRKRELSTLDGCILWGARVIVPPQGRKLVLQELHDTHLGANKMKALARSYIWWPRRLNSW